MDKKQLIDFIESSFIKDILIDKNITDISYNGKDIFYLNNNTGREKSDIIISQNEVKDFLRQIANLSEKQFSYLNPILDISVGKYRINAVNSSIGKVNEDGAVTFSIRIASLEPKITSTSKFMIEEVESLFDALLLNHISIVICGLPGVGKTEFQKYLISRMPKNERVLIIDNNIELNVINTRDDLDITFWQADDKNKEATVTNLIKNGLRNNPDWMIISEARGEEMNDILLSAMTGIPIITTIHSLDAFHAPNRMAKSIMLLEKKMDYEDVISNINEHFKIFVYLKKYINKDNRIVRYISSIVEIDENGKKNEIYNDDLKKKKILKISKNLSNIIFNNINKKHLGRFIANE